MFIEVDMQFLHLFFLIFARDTVFFGKENSTLLIHHGLFNTNKGTGENPAARQPAQRWHHISHTQQDHYQLYYKI
jgi:hypothetical protein